MSYICFEVIIYYFGLHEKENRWQWDLRVSNQKLIIEELKIIVHLRGIGSGGGLQEIQEQTKLN